MEVERNYNINPHINSDAVQESRFETPFGSDCPDSGLGQAMPQVAENPKTVNGSILSNYGLNQDVAFDAKSAGFLCIQGFRVKENPGKLKTGCAGFIYFIGA